MCDVLCAVLYVRIKCFVVRGRAVSRYINVCNCDVLSVVNMYLEHLKFCVLMVKCMLVVVNAILSLTSVMSTTPDLCDLSVRTLVKLCTFGVVGLKVNIISVCEEDNVEFITVTCCLVGGSMWN